MTAITHPTPAQVRDWMRQQIEAKKAPPSPDEIRRELGWNLVKVEVTR